MVEIKFIRDEYAVKQRSTIKNESFIYLHDKTETVFSPATCDGNQVDLRKDNADNFIVEPALPNASVKIHSVDKTIRVGSLRIFNVVYVNFEHQVAQIIDFSNGNVKLINMMTGRQFTLQDGIRVIKLGEVETTA